VRTVVENCVRRHIPVLTLFAFSSENWKRPKEEVSLLMDLFMTVLQREVKKLHRNGVKLRVIGDRSAFSTKLQEQIAEAEHQTAENTGLVLQIAANYGGRWDVAEAARRLGMRVEKGSLRPQDITEAALAEELSFPALPDPDLFIRTGGEKRLSNFLLWQAAYSELYFTDVLWPDFDGPALDRALHDYGKRRRRFGLTDDQLRSEAPV
jgi:undecaprenyl diphosphate synthase